MFRIQTFVDLVACFEVANAAAADCRRDEWVRRRAAVRESVLQSRIVKFDVDGFSTLLSSLGSVVKTALWMPCLALGLDLRISGITLLTVSFALLARSERLFA